QNITAKSEESRANMQFIQKNAKRLPSLEEVEEAYIQCRNEWNQAIHPKYGKPRIEVYNESKNPQAEELTILDMVEIFWLERPKPIKYFNHGISITLLGVKYEYEVLTEEGLPDMEFRSKHIDDKFIVKYDPADLSHIRLYKQTSSGLVFTAIAQTRIVVHRAIQDQKPGERSLINKLLEVNRAETAKFKEQEKWHQEKFENEYYAIPSKPLKKSYDKKISLDDVIDHPDEFNIYDRM